MARVTGIGGIFFKSDDPERLYQWYETHLGIRRDPHGGDASFRWRTPDNPEANGMTIWAIFPRDTTYFDPSSRSRETSAASPEPNRAPFMINFRVDDLDALLDKLRTEGVWIDPKREDYDYGRFAWIMDPEGNRIELWQPPPGD
jgi:predicted enzyme related to lactoylglutathione lyase